MWTLATCRASIYRGYTTDPDTGDQIPSATPLATGITASITERGTRVWDSSTQTPRIVRVVEGVFPSTVDIAVGDRVVDDTNGETFTVQEVTRPRAAGRRPDTVTVLRRVG